MPLRRLGTGLSKGLGTGLSKGLGMGLSKGLGMGLGMGLNGGSTGTFEIAGRGDKSRLEH